MDRGQFLVREAASSLLSLTTGCIRPADGARLKASQRLLRLRSRRYDDRCQVFRRCVSEPACANLDWPKPEESLSTWPAAMSSSLLHRERSFRGRPDARPSPTSVHRLQRLLGLVEDEYEALARLFEGALHQVGPRSIIADEGEPQAQAYLILEGWACRCRFVDMTRRQITALLLPGDFSNPELDLDPRLGIDHVVCSLTPLTYAVVDTCDLIALVAHSPGLALALQLQRRRERSIQREWAVSLGRRSAIERVAHLICELHRRLHCDPSKPSLTIDMPLLQADLADAVGLTSIHVNRMLQQLRGLGLIKSGHNHITISDLAGLQRLACFDETYLRLAGLS